MYAFLAATRRAREGKKQQEISVQQLNKEQQQKEKIQEILEQKKEARNNSAVICSLIFALSWMLFIVAFIVLISALLYRQEIFFIGFGVFLIIASCLLIIGCCFNDCCDRQDNQEKNAVEDGLDDEELTPSLDSSQGMADSGINMCYDVPYHIPVRLGSPNASMSFLHVRQQYGNLPTVVST